LGIAVQRQWSIGDNGSKAGCSILFRIRDLAGKEDILFFLRTASKAHDLPDMESLNIHPPQRRVIGRVLSFLFAAIMMMMMMMTACPTIHRVGTTGSWAGGESVVII
jgi:hypothetical protein